ncbi:MAG: EAL domain-containing protein [Acidimicrobiales bacterium]
MVSPETSASGQLVLHYQPILELVPGGDRIVGFEALLRWQHQRLGLIGPDAFLGLAETAGCLASIESWVLSQACADAAGWPAPGAGAGSVIVCVNLSPGRLADPLIIHDVKGALELAGLAPGRLAIEVIEDGVVRDMASVPGILAELRGLGALVSLDGFGAGYSSLGRLASMPLDSVKLDRAFQEQACTGAGPASMPGFIHSVVALVHSLGLRCIADGLETDDQVERARQSGCEMGQGFALGRPVPADEVAGFLAGERSGGSGPVGAPVG